MVCASSNDDHLKTCQTCGAPLQSSANSSILHCLPSDSYLLNGRYRVDSQLGEGGFGITYRGTDLKTSQKVVIKELWPEKGGRHEKTVIWPMSISPKEKKQQLKKFQIEAEYQHQCKHPCIAEVYSWFEENDTAYIIMEFISGQSLFQILQADGALPEERVKQYFLQVGEALKVVHNHNFLHRDIKPDNIIINTDDKAVLIDFGSTREFIAGQTHEMSQTLTKGYAPLEQYSYRSKRWPATDFYSLCASMYELLTGNLPTEAVLRVQEKSDPLIPPSRYCPSISPLMEKVILIGLNMKVEHRFQDADEIIAALKGQFIAPIHKKARELANKNKIIEANRAYETFLSKEPGNAEAIVEMAMLQLYFDISRAEQTGHRAIKAAPNDGRGFGVLGLIECQKKQLGKKHLNI
ncbi:serine/threonine protein kinase [Acaryochloris sp. 'Moss Beach']|uniref:serine/threonine-protein kinase n=1 Tax=Acaryochloris sp. 'Moss Beach' TaxID=2740837 RepID=UPI001F15C4D6|nr:serine/threonine-protein kinase [Acaryochloris sp. 'Moss Beach']UJB68985.1 serine/threonine protein kinase [Acaryochloris sp. 'Moss Beach']